MGLTVHLNKAPWVMSVLATEIKGIYPIHSQLNKSKNKAPHLILYATIKKTASAA